MLRNKILPRLLVAMPLIFSCQAFADAQPMTTEQATETCSVSELSSEGGWWHSTAAIMGTEIRVELWHDNQSLACTAIDGVMAEMRRIDAYMSPYIESSALSLLNKNGANNFVDVGEELFSLISRSQGYSILTGGAFDITYASAGRYYNYRKNERPDDETLRQAVEAINYRHLELDHRKHAIKFHHPHVYVDLGGIAKGHAVDKAIKLLKDQGIEQAMVSAGGDSQIIGDRRGEPWVVGVKDPRNPNAQAVVLPLMDASISTSGDYERFFVEDGVRYHHIIDPASGDSARKVSSVTIIGSESTAADALSTSVFVMGPKKGIELIDRLRGIDVIVVDGRGEMFVSDGLAQMQPTSVAGVAHE